MNWYIDAWKNYFTFTGRARRKAYWMFVLFNIIAAIIANVIDNVIGTGGIIGGLYSLAVLLPGIALGIRRLHDIGKSGWWLLIALVPLIGAIVLLVFACTDSQPGENAYGPNPKGA
ncbi:MAG: DUF805 domain-containing protein [Chthoniobacterales bacterium]|jgi:uncharacterized membrane protein YhaH (DUF805 family)